MDALRFDRILWEAEAAATRRSAARIVSAGVLGAMAARFGQTDAVAA